MIVTILILLGLALGSFVNAWVWRVYQQNLPKKKRAGTDKELSVVTGRSMCPDCKHTLAWYDMLPVVSWIMLRGKCRYCKKPVHWQYPVVELAVAGLFVCSYIFWPEELLGLADQVIFASWLAALVGLVALAVYDIRWMLLPNKIVLAVGILAAIGATVRIIAADKPLNGILLLLGSVAVAGGVFYILFQISDGKWIGGGDVKLGLVLGLLLASPVLAFLMLFIASLLGLLFALPGIVTRRRNLTSKLPFGPFLIAGTVFTQLFGVGLVAWYSAMFLYI